MPYSVASFSSSEVRVKHSSPVTEAIITQGSEKGDLRKVCANPVFSIHHPKKQQGKADANFKAEQEKRRKEEALANATGLRVLSSIVPAVPVWLMKRDLLFITENLLRSLDERSLATATRSRGIRSADGESITKLINAFDHKADESALGRLIVDAVIFLSARSQSDAGKVLKTAALLYKVDTDLITLKVSDSPQCAPGKSPHQ